MSFETIDQPTTLRRIRDASVTLRLAEWRGSQMMFVSITPQVITHLGWAKDEPVSLAVGRGGEAGKVMVVPDPNGRALATTPRSEVRCVRLAVPDDLAHWDAPRREAPHQVVQDPSDRKRRALLLTMPWDLSGDPTAARQEEAGAELPEAA